MKVGFTGTRYGMTSRQKCLFHNWIIAEGPVAEFHHGSCMGADIEAADIVRDVFPDCKIHGWPGPDGDPCRRDSGVDDYKHEPENHFARNRHIVNAVDKMAAAPIVMEPQPRGGTWYTINYARKKGTPVMLLER